MDRRRQALTGGERGDSGGTTTALLVLSACFDEGRLWETLCRSWGYRLVQWGRPVRLVDKLGISRWPLANMRSEAHHGSSRLGTGWSRTRIAVWTVVVAAAPVADRAPRWAAAPGQLLGWFGVAGLGVVRPRVEPAARCSARAPVSASATSTRCSGCRRVRPLGARSRTRCALCAHGRTTPLHQGILTKGRPFHYHGHCMSGARTRSHHRLLWFAVRDSRTMAAKWIPPS